MQVQYRVFRRIARHRGSRLARAAAYRLISCQSRRERRVAGAHYPPITSRPATGRPASRQQRRRRIVPHRPTATAAAAVRRPRVGSGALLTVTRMGVCASSPGGAVLSPGSPGGSERSSSAATEPDDENGGTAERVRCRWEGWREGIVWEGRERWEDQREVGRDWMEERVLRRVQRKVRDVRWPWNLDE